MNMNDIDKAEQQRAELLCGDPLVLFDKYEDALRQAGINARALQNLRSRLYDLADAWDGAKEAVRAEELRDELDADWRQAT